MTGTTVPLLHFSEDPTIERFEPHVPATNSAEPPAVWAIDEAHAPLYWYPRDCPRGTVWARNADEQAQLTYRFDTQASRIHVVERDWRERVRAVALYAYAFHPASFAPWPDAYGYYVSQVPVTPIAVEPVGELVQRHEDEGIELRFVSNVWPFWDTVVTMNLAFSGVRLRNARPR